MDKWVSDILNIDFKLGRGNSSNHYNCKLELNDSFIERYNSIYDVYDIQSNIKKII